MLLHSHVRNGICTSSAPFLKINDAEAPKDPRPITLKKWSAISTLTRLKLTFTEPLAVIQWTQ